MQKLFQPCTTTKASPRRAQPRSDRGNRPTRGSGLTAGSHSDSQGGARAPGSGPTRNARSPEPQPPPATRRLRERAPSSAASAAFGFIFPRSHILLPLSARRQTRRGSAAPAPLSPAAWSRSPATRPPLSPPQPMGPARVSGRRRVVLCLHTRVSRLRQPQPAAGPRCFCRRAAPGAAAARAPPTAAPPRARGRHGQAGQGRGPSAAGGAVRRRETRADGGPSVKRRAEGKGVPKGKESRGRRAPRGREISGRYYGRRGEEQHHPLTAPQGLVRPLGAPFSRNPGEESPPGLAKV